MLNIEFYKTSWLFQLKEFKDSEVIFDEWSNDENLYIIVSWKVLVGKYTTIEKKDIKELAILNELDFFWEASLNSNQPKEAIVKAIGDTTLIFINWKNWLKDFTEKYPKEWFDLLSYIIESTNKRLIISNKLITSNYEIVKSITEIENINDKSVFNIIDKMILVTDYDYILFFEVNQVIKDYLVLKYDTREVWKFQDIVIERNKFANLKDVKEIVLENFNFVQKLSIWKVDLWFMVFSKKTSFSYEDKKLMLSISNSLTWLLRQKSILKDELNKKSMKEG